MTAPSFSMPVPILTILAQVDLVGGALGVVLSVVVSFAIIALVSSYYRFQHIVEQAEEKDPEEMGTSARQVLRVHLARYLAGCGRRGTSFSLALIRMAAADTKLHINSDALKALKHAVRRDDLVCLYDDQTAALLAESEPEDAENMLARINKSASDRCEEIERDLVRVGIASYPGHGHSGKDLVEMALDALEKTNAELPVFMPEIVELEEEEEDEEGNGAEEQEPGDDVTPDSFEEEYEESGDDDEDADRTGGLRGRRKKSILDPVTGVLKPSVVSIYMKRMLSDLRYKKERAALFCVGVNNMEHIARFHGDEAADCVLAGVSKVLQDHLRADDLIGRHEKYAFIVLAKCSLEEAEGIGKRVSTLMQQAQFEAGHKKLKTTITLGVSTYPEHGRNLHHLYTASQKVLDHSRMNDIRAYAVYDPEIHDKVPSKPMRSIKSIKA